MTHIDPAVYAKHMAGFKPRTPRVKVNAVRLTKVPLDAVPQFVQEIRVRLPLPPTGNHYKKPNRRGKNLTWYLTPEAKAFKAAVAGCGIGAMIEGPLLFRATIYRKSKAGDLDNFAKVLLDSCQGVFFENDKQVHEIHLTLRDDKSNPGCDVLLLKIQ